MYTSVTLLSFCLLFNATVKNLSMFLCVSGHKSILCIDVKNDIKDQYSQIPLTIVVTENDNKDVVLAKLLYHSLKFAYDENVFFKDFLSILQKYLFFIRTHYLELNLDI